MSPENRNLQSGPQPECLPLSVPPNLQDERRSQLNVEPPHVVQSHPSDGPPQYHLTSHSQPGRSLPQSVMQWHYPAEPPSVLVRQLQQPVLTPLTVPSPFVQYSQPVPFQQLFYQLTCVHEAPSNSGYLWNYSNQMPMNNNCSHYVSHDGGSYQFPHYQNYNDAFQYHHQDFNEPRYKRSANNNEPHMNAYEINNSNDTRSYGSSSSLHNLNFNSPVNSEQSCTNNNNEANGLCLESINKNASNLNLDTSSLINKEVISESDQKQNSTVTPSKKSAAHLIYSTQNVNKPEISLQHPADIAKCSIQEQSTQNCLKENNTKRNLRLSLEERVVNDKIRDDSTKRIRRSRAKSSSAVFNHETEVIHKTLTIPTVQSTTNKSATTATSNKNSCIHSESQIANNQPLNLQCKNQCVNFCNNLQNVRKQHYEITNDKKQNDNVDQKLQGIYSDIDKESTDKNQNVDCRSEPVSASKRENKELDINTPSKRSQPVDSNDVKVTSNVVHKSWFIECADKDIDVEKQNDDIEQQPHKTAHKENEYSRKEEICTNKQENKDISTCNTSTTKKRSRHLYVDLSNALIKINNVENNEPLDLSKQGNLTCNNLSRMKRSRNIRDEWKLMKKVNNTENRSPSLEGGKMDINVEYQNDAIEQKLQENKQEGKIAHTYNTRSKRKRSPSTNDSSYNKDSIKETRHFDSENEPLSLNKQDNKKTNILKNLSRLKSVQSLQKNSEEEVEIIKSTENKGQHVKYDEHINDKQQNSVVKDIRYTHKIRLLSEKDILTNKDDNKENFASTTVSGRNRNFIMCIGSEDIGIASNSENKYQHVDHGGNKKEFKKEKKVFNENNIYINNDDKAKGSNINSGILIKLNECKLFEKQPKMSCQENKRIYKNKGESNSKDDLLKFSRQKQNKKTGLYKNKRFISYDIKHDNEETNQQKKKINIEMFVDKKEVEKPLCNKTEKNNKYNNQRDNINDRKAVKTSSKKKYNDSQQKRHKQYKRIRTIFDSEEDETGSIQQNPRKKIDELDDSKKQENGQQSFISNKINKNYHSNKVTNRTNSNKFKNSFTNHEEKNKIVDTPFLYNKDTQNGKIENEKYKEICKQIGILDEEDDQPCISNKINNDISRNQHDILDVDNKTYELAKCDVRKNVNANTFINQKYKNRKQHYRDIAQASSVFLSPIVNNCVIIPKPNNELDLHSTVEQLTTTVGLNTTNQNLPETVNLPRRAKPSKKRKFWFDTLNAKVKRGAKQNKHTAQRLGAKLANIPQLPSGCNSTDNSGKSTFTKLTTIINDKKIKQKNKSSLEKTVGKKITFNELTHSSTNKKNLSNDHIKKEKDNIEKNLEKLFMVFGDDSLVISSLENLPDQLSEYKETSDNVNNNNLNNPNNCSINSSNTSAIVGSNLPQTQTTDTQEPSFDTEQYSGQSTSHNLGNQYAVENSTAFETPMLISNQSLLASDDLADDGTARTINNAEKYNDFLKKLTFFVFYSIKIDVVNNQIMFDEDFQTESRRYRQYFCDCFEQLLNQFERSILSEILPLNEYKKFIKYIYRYINANMEFPTTIGQVDRGLNQGLLQFCSENGHENDSKFYLKIVHVMISLIKSLQHGKSSEIDCLDFTEIDDFVEILLYHKRTEWYSLFTEEHTVFKTIDEWVSRMIADSRFLKEVASWTNQTHSNSMCDLTTGVLKNCKSSNGQSIIKKEEICKLTTDGLGNMQDSIIIIDDDDDTELCQSTNATEKNSDQQRQEN